MPYKKNFLTFVFVAFLVEREVPKRDYDSRCIWTASQDVGSNPTDSTSKISNNKSL